MARPEGAHRCPHWRGADRARRTNGEGEGMASGDVMNTAARIQSAAPSAASSSAKRRIEQRARQSTSAGGTDRCEREIPAGPVWEAAGVRGQEPSTALPQRHSWDATELEQLLAAWEAGRRGRVTRLVGVRRRSRHGEDASARRVRPSASGGRRVHWGDVSRTAKASLLAVSELVKSAAGILQSDDRATAHEARRFIDGLPTNDRDELRRSRRHSLT